jgi:hypothetical protein
LLADVLDPPKWCIGCGHDSRIPLGEKLCCPDNNYLTVEEIMARMKAAEDRVRAESARVRELHAEIELLKNRIEQSDRKMRYEKPAPRETNWGEPVPGYYIEPRDRKKFGL